MHVTDTNIDAFQGDTVHLIETSGRTLLDTLDHVRLLLFHPQGGLDLYGYQTSRLVTDYNSCLTIAKSTRILVLQSSHEDSLDHVHEECKVQG